MHQPTLLATSAQVLRRPWHQALALAAAAMLAACAAPPPASPGKPTLQDRRSAINKGTAPGIVLYSSGAPAPDEASAPRSAPPTAPTPPSAGQPATPGKPAAAPSASGTPGLLGALPPPSGRSAQEAKKLNAPDQGIPLPVGGPASAAR